MKGGDVVFLLWKTDPFTDQKVLQGVFAVKQRADHASYRLYESDATKAGAIYTYDVERYKVS